MEAIEYDIATIKNLLPFASGLDFQSKDLDPGTPSEREVMHIRVKTKAQSPYGGAVAVIECSETPETAEVLAHIVQATFAGLRHELCERFTIWPAGGGAPLSRKVDDITWDPSRAHVGLEGLIASRYAALEKSIRAIGFNLFGHGTQANGPDSPIIIPLEWENPGMSLDANVTPLGAKNQAPQREPVSPRLNPNVLSKVSTAFARFGK